MQDFDDVWDRIRRHAGETFHTATGLPFGEEINRSLSKTNFAKAAAVMPATGPGDLKDRQGSSYTWAILMDRRIRQNDW